MYITLDSADNIQGFEKIQQDSAQGKLNTTIVDGYFSSACSRPASVFPRLVELSNYHMKKLDADYRCHQRRRHRIVCRFGQYEFSGNSPKRHGCFLVPCNRKIHLMPWHVFHQLSKTVRIGIIKAYINRKYRIEQKREEIKMALDNEEKNTAYRCGRLFAVW